MGHITGGCPTGSSAQKGPEVEIGRRVQRFREDENRKRRLINELLERVLDADNGAENESLQICTTQCLIRLDLFIASGIE